jgi:transposase
MPKGTRRKFTPEFKAKVALAALKGDKSLAELAQEYDVHPQMITRWKSILEKEATKAFETGGGTETVPDTDSLYKRIGQLEMERDFLASRPAIRSLFKDDGK